jgi:hypothetical protein
MKGPAVQKIYTKAARAPQLADRTTVPADELEAYDRAVELVRKYSDENSIARARPFVAGEPYAQPYRVAWTNAPALCSAFLDAAWITSRRAGKPGWYLPADHEMVDLVLGFDAEYMVFHAGHTANAVACGVRIAAMRALRHKEEHLLTAEEELVVTFIRAVRDGEMTDELWDQMLRRIGTLEGTIAMAYQVAILSSIQQMMSVFGVPAMRPEEWDRLIDAYESGEIDPSDSTQDWVWETIKELEITRGTA